jgi:hypothetical protein
MSIYVYLIRQLADSFFQLVYHPPQSLMTRKKGSSDSRNRLNVDFLALLADCSPAARGGAASPQGAAVESVLQLPAVLSFLPFFASQASMGRPYFCWILSLYHSGMTLNEQKG